ncbi:MAG: hypothetical protein ACRDP3_01050 [Streptomyces sp.]|uniref:hypothetical protein n=1 Tax=Streptomyces sp. TaxID=1931 RepID=UPI003D6A94B6
MSAISLILLATAVSATVVGGAALHTARGLRRQLRTLSAECTGTVPHARTAEEIRTVVVEALAEERERELAEARAFWAAQDGDADDGALLAGHGTEYEVAPGLDAKLFDAVLEGQVDDETLAGLRDLRDRGVPEAGVFVPRQYGRENEPALNSDAEPMADENSGEAGSEPSESSELTAARRRHPSQPDFTLNGEPAVPGQAPSSAPAVPDHERTVGRLAELAEARTALTDVRQGPLGTLDVYLFEDGTTVCLSPGHRETAGRLCAALRQGDVPYLMGGSSVSGAYALTFAYGEGRTAYLLADRVIAS